MPLVRGAKLANKLLHDLAGEGASDGGSNQAAAGASVGIQCVVGPPRKSAKTRLDLLKKSLRT